MSVFSRGRRWARTAGGVRDVHLLLAAGIATVLVTRSYLAATGYPQVGNGTLHIAHALWGGMLMLAGLLTALMFTDTAARTWTALLGGVGFGLFVDEVGKFITQKNDYFFRPAAAIIYLLFAGLLLLAAQVRDTGAARAGRDIAGAAAVAAAGLSSGLTPARRASAQRILDGQEGETAQLVQQLLDAAPARPQRWSVQPLVRRLAGVTAWLAGQGWFIVLVFGLFVFSRLIAATVFVDQALPVIAGHAPPPGHQAEAVIASAVTRTLEAVIVVVGAVRWRSSRQAAYGWFTTALLFNLFVTQIFNFTDSQFGALAELPFLLLVLAMLTYHRQRARA
ncbi:hypothetical protein ACFVW8_02565 [Streptomyces sp. NPDC058221]|uniref:hypothetical protein n=1 Tax=Streptomyces sp. NPDC058221 TaxID=3346388 RepID=UPI0036EAE693